MLRELISIFKKSDNPISRMGKNFTEMVELALDNTLVAGDVLFSNEMTAQKRSRVYDQDVDINKLERKIRKSVVAHLSIEGNHYDVPYCLLMMNLVKDIERIGDYAKNMLEAVEILSEPLPMDNAVVQELLEIRSKIEQALRATPKILQASEMEHALRLIHQGRDIAHRCDVLITKIAQTKKMGPQLTTVLVLAVRYYKRIGGHSLNVLSSVVMPLHKIDYFDEDEVTSKVKLIGD